jgi:hypothetical protein
VAAQKRQARNLKLQKRLRMLSINSSLTWKVKTCATTNSQPLAQNPMADVVPPSQVLIPPPGQMFLPWLLSTDMLARRLPAVGLLMVPLPVVGLLPVLLLMLPPNHLVAHSFTTVIRTMKKTTRPLPRTSRGHERLSYQIQ